MKKFTLFISVFLLMQTVRSQGLTAGNNLLNRTNASFAVTQAPHLSLPAGFYKGPLQLTVENAQDAVVHYTLDGSPPGENSMVYTTALILDSTVVVRARSFSSNPLALPSAITTQTYFIDFSSDLPIFSLSTHPGNLFNWDTGIYVLGPNASPNYPYLGANYWQDWERPVYVEFFETNHQLEISQDAGISINGGSVSRTRPMQSLRLTADSIYGTKRFDHRFFSQKSIDKYKMLVLRNSSGDYNKTHFRDGCLHKLMIGRLNIDLLCYRPCVVFINGQYWGVYNIREKFSKHYLEENYGIDGDDIDLLEEDSTIIHGDFQAFNAMLNFVTSNDMALVHNYDSAARLLDISSLCDYFIAETYLSNIDWPKNNIKYWRVREMGSKWRYLLMDLDISLGNWGWAPAEMDVLGRLLGPFGYDNKHARLLKALLRNRDFREYFINRYADLVNTVFSSASMWDNIEKVKADIETEMPRHFQRWPTNNMQGWNDEIYTVVKPYIEKRPAYALQYVQDTFKLTQQVKIKLDVWPPSTALVKINTLSFSILPWQGIYFDGVPVSISVEPVKGYHFLRWLTDSLDLTDYSSPSLKVNVNKNTSFTALMEPDDHSACLYVYPNPMVSQFNMGLVLPEPEAGELTLVDMLGNEVIRMDKISLVSGLNIQVIDVTALAKGVYYVQLSTQKQKFSARIVKAQ